MHSETVLLRSHGSEPVLLRSKQHTFPIKLSMQLQSLGSNLSDA